MNTCKPADLVAVADPDKCVFGFVTDFNVQSEEVRLLTTKADVHALTKTNDALCEADKKWKELFLKRKVSFRWVHLPANNMEWVTDAMFQVANSGTSDPQQASQLQSSILSNEHWQNVQDRISSRPQDSRHMRPYCRAIEISRTVSMDTFDGFDFDSFDSSWSHRSRDNQAIKRTWVLYMPYIHWEYALASAQIDCIANSVSKPPSNGTEKINDALIPEHIRFLPCCNDEKLLRRYLRTEQPMHMRRPLGTSFYQGLKEPLKNSLDQVFGRHAEKSFDSELEGPPVLVVDQLWLWVIGGHTILTCFPQRWHAANEADGIKDIIDSVLDSFSIDQTRQGIKDVQDVAALIIERCASSMFQTSLPASLSMQGIDVYDDAINDLLLRRDRRYKRLWRDIKFDVEASNGDLFNILEEYQMLHEVKGIIGELQLLGEIVEQQTSALQSYRSQVDLRTCGGTSSCLLDSATSRSKALQRLSQKAANAYESINDLLSAKQHQAQVSEARSSKLSSQQIEKLARDAEQAAKEDRRQGDAIMLFTSITIIFLPISSLASVFGMNAAEFGQGDVRLRTFFAYLVPISAAVIILTMFLAWNPKIRRVLMLTMQILVAAVTLILPTGRVDGLLVALERKLQRLRTRRHSQ